MGESTPHFTRDAAHVLNELAAVDSGDDRCMNLNIPEDRASSTSILYKIQVVPAAMCRCQIIICVSSRSSKDPCM